MPESSNLLTEPCIPCTQAKFTEDVVRFDPGFLQQLPLFEADVNPVRFRIHQHSTVTSTRRFFVELVVEAPGLGHVLFTSEAATEPDEVFDNARRALKDYKALFDVPADTE